MEAKIAYLSKENARLLNTIQNLQLSLKINKQMLVNALTDKELFTDKLILEDLAIEQTQLHENLQELTERNENLEAQLLVSEQVFGELSTKLIDQQQDAESLQNQCKENLHEALCLAENRLKCFSEGVQIARYLISVTKTQNINVSSSEIRLH